VADHNLGAGLDTTHRSLMGQGRGLVYFTGGGEKERQQKEGESDETETKKGRGSAHFRPVAG